MTRSPKTPEQLDEVRKQKLLLLRQTNRDLSVAQSELSGLRRKAAPHDILSGTLQVGRVSARRGRKP